MRCSCCFEENETCSCKNECQLDSLLLPSGLNLCSGQYIIGKVLGSPGGFGITYLGWDTRLDIKVAIKEYLPRHLARRSGTSTSVEPHTRSDKEGFDYGLIQFLAEAKTLAQLRHPNIVRVLNYFEENETGYIVMDYLDGESLQEYMTRTGPINAEDAIALMLPVFEALDYLHSKGIIHRDVKPSNIYITHSGQPVLLDFGSARQALSSASASMTAVVSPGYAPIEQYNRKGKQGPYTDIYSCSALLYQMISGVQPQESMERNIDDELLPLSQVAPSVLESVSNGIMWGLNINPKERPQSISAVISCLISSIEDIKETQKNIESYSVDESKEQLIIPNNPPIPTSDSRSNNSSIKNFVGIAVVLLIAVLLYYWDSNGERTIDHTIYSGKTGYAGTYTGQVRGGKPNGLGTFKYSFTHDGGIHFYKSKIENVIVKNDVTYTGGFNNGQIEGKGTRITNSEVRYKNNPDPKNPDGIVEVLVYKTEGEWLGGILSGKAIIEVSGKKNRCIEEVCKFENYYQKFDGMMKNGDKFGQGTQLTKRGSDIEKLEGTWENDLEFSGKADEISNLGRYVGEYKGYGPHGKGIFTYTNDGKYDGMWEMGQYAGQGERVYGDGSRHIGTWKKGKAEGLGEYVFTDGVKVVGAFKEGIPVSEDGKLRIVLPNGRMVWGRCSGTGKGGFECKWYE